ncbi:MAG: hypothetical protein HUU10_02425 [Bacteroidetes bacterium]|nr:hypothetical protein [Bacteroidota bacterium]
MNRFFIWFVFIILPVVGAGQSLGPVRLITESRYDNIDSGRDKNRIQGALRLNWQVQVTGNGSVAGLISTGNSYTSRWADLRDFKVPGQRFPFTMNLRHLFWLQTGENWRIQAGAIPSVKGFVSSTGLGGNGWIDGMRADYRFESLTAEMVAGSLYDVTNPNFFERRMRANYAEVELSFRTSKVISFEVSAEQVNRTTYGRSEYRHRLNGSGPGWIELTAEALVNLTDRAGSVGLTAETDLLAWITPEWENRLELWAYLNHTDPAIGTRGRLMDDFYTTGGTAAIEFEVRLNEEGTLFLFQKSTFADVSRFDIGLKLDLKKN